MNPAPPPVSLADGSLNKEYINKNGRKECLSLCRDVIRINAIPAYFATKSTKRVNRSLTKVRNTTKAVSERIKLGFRGSEEMTMLNMNTTAVAEPYNRDINSDMDGAFVMQVNDNDTNNNNNNNDNNSRDKKESVKFKDDFVSVGDEADWDGDVDGNGGDDNYEDEAWFIYIYIHLIITNIYMIIVAMVTTSNIYISLNSTI